MNPVIRIAIYLALIAVAVFCGQRFFATYSRNMEKAAMRFDTPEPTNSAAVESPSTTDDDTTQDAAATDTNSSPSNASGTRTNQTSVRTNTPARVETGRRHDVSIPTAGAVPKPGGSMLGVNAFFSFAAVVVLGLLVAQDISHFLAVRAHRALYNEEGVGASNPDYERAEQVWADGDPLEAVRLLREYLNKNPREVHVMLRIAEIYEKDLNNNLAAALEYEQVLKFKLEPERWGWAAIHLCNLYNRMNQPEKTQALLRRIVNEYGETAAAKKARERVDMTEIEPVPQPQIADEEPRSEPEGSQGFKLPPGFRPKKG